MCPKVKPKKKKKKKDRDVCKQYTVRQFRRGQRTWNVKEVPCDVQPDAPSSSSGSRKKRPKYPPGNPFPQLEF